MSVALKATIVNDSLVQSLFASVTEGRMPQVVRETRRCHKVPRRQPSVYASALRVRAAQCPEQSFADLCRLNGMSQAGAMKIAFTDAHDLRLRLEPSKRRRVYHTCPVSLIGVAVVVGSR